MSDKMYVWEVREYVDHEGDIWSILIKDDEYTLEKVKSEIVKQYESSCYYEDIKREQTNIVNKLDSLIDFQKFKMGMCSQIEVEKIEVI